MFFWLHEAKFVTRSTMPPAWVRAMQLGRVMQWASSCRVAAKAQAYEEVSKKNGASVFLEQKGVAQGLGLSCTPWESRLLLQRLLVWLETSLCTKHFSSERESTGGPDHRFIFWTLREKINRK
jgi:hypothetical protein